MELISQAPSWSLMALDDSRRPRWCQSVPGASSWMDPDGSRWLQMVMIGPDTHPTMAGDDSSWPQMVMMKVMMLMMLVKQSGSFLVQG